ncbi:hypothetical protein AK830_g9595 [Neonectria ditissima]|uniref:MYND-type domain-containing protein n=1 Tax=Neonectria ditissima TaxID=78410 RepID=A0A0P7B5H1_9HYPO|nr:hypothetical protein AK830_g9595 [Neonectria ditissima]
MLNRPLADLSLAFVMDLLEFISAGDTRSRDTTPPLPTGCPRLPEDAVFGNKECAKCGQSDSTLSCDLCKVTDVGQLQVFHCSEACQKAHWPDHEAICQARKTLGRSVSMFSDIWTAFETATFACSTAFVDEKLGVITIRTKDDMPNRRNWTGESLIRRFPDDLFPDAASDATKQAFLFDNTCAEPLILGKPLHELFLGPACQKVQVGEVDVKNPAIVVHLRGTPYYTHHSVFEVTLVTGEVYAVDLTGAQYGFQEKLYEWKTYDTHRAEPGSEISTLDDAEESERVVHMLAGLSIHGRAMAVKNLRETVMRDLRRSIDGYVRSKKATIKDMMLLPDSEFRVARQQLVTHAKTSLQNAVERLAHMTIIARD